MGHDHDHDHADHDHPHGHDHDHGTHSHKGHDHSHGHAHAHALPSGPNAAAKLARAFFLIIIVLAVELGVAIISNSLALLADAGHVLTDLVALGLSWFAVRQAERPPTAQRTYGFHRTGIMVALFNAATLLIIAVYILHEAYVRLRAVEPAHIEGGLMMIAAFVGLVVNLWVGYDLSSEQGENLNVKSAVLHVMGDAAASLGVIIAAALIWWQPTWTWLDPTIAALIAVLIAVGAWQILHDSAVVLMEGVPANIDMDQLVNKLLKVPGVDGVHDLHVWCIASGLPMLTCHVLLHEIDVVSSAAALNGMRDVLADDFGIKHSTIQPEWELCGPANLYCTMDMLKRAPESDKPHEMAVGGQQASAGNIAASGEDRG